jgi:FkbM family methyltransferase
MPSDSLSARAIRTAARWLGPLELARFPLVRRLYRGAYRSMVKPGELAEVRVGGARLQIDPHDGGVGYALFVGRGYEPLTSELCAGELAPGMTAIDLGANVGYYTVLFAEKVGPKGRVFAFEPAPENVELLERNVKLNGFEQVQVVPKACSDESGTIALHLSRAGKGLHTIGAPGNANWDSVQVEMVRLDDVFPELAFRVDFLKIDIEGAESRALRGMEALIARSDRLRILTEVNPTALEQNGETAEMYLRQLLDYGFEIRAVVDEQARAVRRVELPELLRMCVQRPREVKHWNCNVLVARASTSGSHR